MSTRLNEYVAPSLDGYDALFDTLPLHATAPRLLSKRERNPALISQHYKIPNNKYPNCPALMDDGRAFTDYRSPCFINDMLRTQNGISNSYAYRQFLINNGSKLINTIRDYNIQKSSCRECDAVPINCRNICNVDKNSVGCMQYSSCGQGTCYHSRI